MNKDVPHIVSYLLVPLGVHCMIFLIILLMIILEILPTDSII